MWQKDLAIELNETDVAQRGEIIERYQRLTGKNASTLYAIARKFDFVSGRKTRADKGLLKSGITEDQIMYVAGLVYKTGRENKGGIMPVEAALEIAFDAGIIERGQISHDRMTTLIRERQLDKEQMKAPTPHTEMRSLHPNYCHLADVSVCIQYYLKNGKMGFMDEREFYKNKPHNFAKIKQKLLRYVLTDHFSGLFYLKYFVADGETRENLWDFLKEAWRAKSDSRLPFQGVPFFMLMDAGCAQTSKAMKNFFKGLGITIPKGKPHNPRRQGSVETTHNIIEKWFETKLRICPAQNVEELNEWAMDFMIWFHAFREHTRHGMTRLESWQLIKTEQLRIMPSDEILNILFVEPEVECLVRNYRFNFRGLEFNVKHLPGMHHKAKVMVALNPYRWSEEKVVTVVWNNTPFEVCAIEKLDATLGGFSVNSAVIGESYKAQPETTTQQSIKLINEMAHGTREPKRDSIPFEGTPVFGNQAEKVGNLFTLPKRGTPIEITRSTESVRISIMDLFKRLRDAGAVITPALNKQLRAEFGDTIEMKRAEEVINAITLGNEWRNPADSPLHLRAM